MDRSQVVAELAEYVRVELLGDHAAELGPTTPLLEWGILNSMNTARLLTHIRERHGVNVPPTLLAHAHRRAPRRHRRAYPPGRQHLPRPVLHRRDGGRPRGCLTGARAAPWPPF